MKMGTKLKCAKGFCGIVSHCFLFGLLVTEFSQGNQCPVITSIPSDFGCILLMTVSLENTVEIGSTKDTSPFCGQALAVTALVLVQSY